MSWKPEFLVQGGWYDNAQRFETEAEAKASAYARFMVWTMPDDYRASESTDPVNYRWDDETGNVSLATAEQCEPQSNRSE
jgi:hypothetical protein